MPMMPTRLPGASPLLTSAEYTVAPAHSNGLATRDSRPSGIGKQNRESHTTWLAKPPSTWRSSLRFGQHCS